MHAKEKTSEVSSKHAGVGMGAWRPAKRTFSWAIQVINKHWRLTLPLNLQRILFTTCYFRTTRIKTTPIVTISASGLSFMTDIAMVTVQTMLSAFDFVSRSRACKINTAVYISTSDDPSQFYLRIDCEQSLSFPSVFLAFLRVIKQQAASGDASPFPFLFLICIILTEFRA